jgi:hypothetical protein
MIIYIYMAYKTYSGKFLPSNPQKYNGDHTNIDYRSSWECKLMSYLDKESSVISWSSEELAIPYISPVDGRYHRYFVDFIVQVRTSDGKLKTIMIEVKPKKQTMEPQKRKRITKQYIQEVTTWGVNQAKWKAANEYCMDRGWEFKIMTEEHLKV